MQKSLLVGGLILLIQALLAINATAYFNAYDASRWTEALEEHVFRRALHEVFSSQAVTDSVVINELMPDPNPVVDDLPDAEFVELYNNSNRTVNAQDWTFNQKAIPDFSLPTGEYLILCKSTHVDLFTPYGSVVGLDSWPTLSNGGATLQLKDAEGNLIDKITYGKAEVTGGYSLERINPAAPCDQRSNYDISTSFRGATPGAQNALFDETPDTRAPGLLSVVAPEAHTIRLIFDEAVVANALQATLSPEVPLAEIKPDTNEKVVLLLLDQALISGSTYTVQLSAVSDCSGNRQDLPPRAFDYDDQPPGIYQLLLLDTAELLVVYDEPVASASATKKEHYQIDNAIGTAVAAEQQDSMSVRVLFSQALSTPQAYQLTITGVADLYNNVVDPPLTYRFSYQDDIDTVIAVGAYQVDVRFDQPLSSVAPKNFSLDRGVGVPSAAWVDVEQSSVVHLVLARSLSANQTHTLSVRGLTTPDGNPLSTPAYRFQYDTKPPRIDSVVTENATSLIVYFNEAVRWNTAQSFEINQTIGFPTAVTQLSDRRVLLSLARALTEETTYRLSVTDIADLSGNTLTGNKTFIHDHRPPSLLVHKIVAAHQIHLTFSEHLLRSSASEVTRYTLGGVPPDSVAVSTIHPERVKLFFAAPVPEQTTVLQAKQLADLRGNVMAPAERSMSNQYPTLGQTVVLSPHRLRLDFSKPLDSNRMQAAANYRLDKSTSPSSAVVEEASVTLTLSNRLVANQSYSLTIKQAVDRRGNQTKNVTDTVVYQTLVKSVELAGASSLLLTFTVPLQVASATEVRRYAVDGVGHPAAAILEKDNVVRLVFSQNFATQTIYSLTIQDLLNQDHDPIPVSYHDFGQGDRPARHDLLITEIMADPSPPIGLPEAEYLELHNPTTRVISTQGVRLSDKTTTATLPTIVLAPGEYVMLCASADQEKLSTFGRVLPVRRFPSLNISGDSLQLTDKEGNEIVSVAYTDEWYNDAEKRRGGWSLEMIDTSRPCGGRANWTASTATVGGTPGQENAVKQDNPDGLGPRLVRAMAVASTRVVLYFDEPLLPSQHTQVHLSDGLTVEALTWPTNRRRLIIQLSQPMRARKQYTVRVGSVTDCSGNLIQDTDNTAQFTLAEPARIGDVLLSEVLFYPRPHGEKFVEIYNHSEKSINLKNWKLANADGDSLINLKIITSEDYLLSPGQYLALTEDPATLKADYAMAPPEHLLEIPNLPSLPASEGTIVLLSATDTVMQQFDYQDTYHHPILRDKQGVSLERIDWEMPTNEPATWQSAARTVNYATPGYKNSQTSASLLAPATLTVDPKVFAPDNTGDRDYTRIHYTLAQPGGVANVLIFDAQGQQVRTLANNLTLGESGSLVWDGTDDRRQRVNVGYYLIYFEVFDTQGRVNVFKDKVVVGGIF